MIDVRPYNDAEAMAVLQNLDPHDHMEAELVRGRTVAPLELFADWRAVNGARILSFVIRTGPELAGTPFAVLALSHTGQSGVAQAAFLARSHKKFRRHIIETGLRIRRGMPKFCADNGIHRIEARCWADHPTASRFLAQIGFECEADMAGFGTQGQVVFHQFAFIQTPRPIQPQKGASHVLYEIPED